MLISKNHKFIFFANESSGSRAAYTAFKSTFGASEVNSKHENEIPADVLADIANYKLIVSCREPFRRLISVYHRLITDEQFAENYGKGVTWDTFSEFLNFIQIHKGLPVKHPTLDWHGGGNFRWVNDTWITAPRMQQTVYTEIVNQTGRIDFFLKQESLQADFNALPFVTNPVVLDVIGKSPIAPDEYFTADNYAVVSTYIRPEYDLYGYTEPVFAS